VRAQTGAVVEVHTPDFIGKPGAIERVVEAAPEVFNHNTETVPRLYRLARPGGRYPRALELLERARRLAPAIPTKTGLMVGLGETIDEVHEVLRDLRRVDCQILTIGQYLKPRDHRIEVARYVHPDEFAEFKRLAYEKGFEHCESGPLVRSSYHAESHIDRPLV
jgi:lipoic acid synthetase